ncbi:hypothetical protein [Halobacterium jilantaiense]|uniref:hypothetical protein n=1 Tax=Halobacterium jilantaiense TaxID=355548 RepID=UPI00115F99B0|nr:hypothetical protein [Halobacterium jilantaiense]
MPTDDRSEVGRATYRVHSDAGRANDWASATTYVLADDWEQAMDAVEAERDRHAVSAVYETDRPTEDAQLVAQEVLADEA